MCTGSEVIHIMATFSCFPMFGRKILKYYSNWIFQFPGTSTKENCPIEPIIPKSMLNSCYKDKDKSVSEITHFLIIEMGNGGIGEDRGRSELV